MNKYSLYKNEDVVQKYDKDRYGGPFGQYLENLEVGTFLSMIDPESERILDLGAGTGKLSIPLILKSKEVLSVDSSANMLRVAGLKSHKLNIEIIAIISDAHYLSFRDRTFDCVVSSRLLMHLIDWEKGIKEICRVSRKELVIDFPSNLSFASLDILFKRIKRIFLPETQVYNKYSIGDIAKEIKKNGFQVVQTRKEFFIPFTLHRLFNHPKISNKIERIFRKFYITELFGNPVTLKAIRKNNSRNILPGEEIK